MNTWKKAIMATLLICTISISQPPQLEAQCPMCRMSAENNLKQGGTQGKGLNAGILYMLATPYMLVGLIGFVWWRNNHQRRQNGSEEEEASFE